MNEQQIQKLHCLQDDHQKEIETVCQNQLCKEFRLNCYKCITIGRGHCNHIDDVERIQTLIKYSERKNQEYNNLIDDLNIFIDRVNQSFTYFKTGIQQKFQIEMDRLYKLNSLQINDYLNSTLNLIEYKQSIKTIVQYQTEKLINSFNNLYGQLKLSSFDYYQIDDKSLKLSKELYDKGYDLYWKHKYEEAIKALYASIQQYPKNLQSHWCIGACLRYLNKNEEAIIWLDKALEIDPKHVNSLLEKGVCLRLLYKYEDAIISLNKALAIEPRNLYSLSEKGQCLRSLNKYGDSITFLDKALTIDPKHVSSLSEKGKCLRLQNQFEDAITWLDKALYIEPKHLYSLSEKGKCLRLLKRYSQSISYLDQALSINNRHSFSLQTKGDCLRDQKKYKDAIIFYEQALKVNPNDQYTKNQKEFCQRQLKQ